MSRFDRSLRPYRSSSSSPQRARATARMGEYQLQQWDAPYLLLDLPLEIQNHIFHFMTAKELYMSVSLVCQEWRELAMQELQWKRLCKRDFEFLVSIFEVKKPRSISWRLWWKFLALDALMYLRTFSAPMLKLAKKQRNSYVVRCRRHEQAATFPFPPPHKLARAQLSLKEGEYNYFEIYIDGMGVEGNTGKEGENTNVKMSEVAEIGVGIATAKAKVNEFLGQNNHGGGYYNNGCIGHSGAFATVLRPRKAHEVEEDYEGEGEAEDVEEKEAAARSEDEGSSSEEGEPSKSQGEAQSEAEKEMVPASPYGAGDIVGVLVDLKTPQRRMGFFVNGDFQGFHYSNLPSGLTFYPAVSLKSYGCKVIAHPLLTHNTHFCIDGEDADAISC